MLPSLEIDWIVPSVNNFNIALSIVSPKPAQDDPIFNNESTNVRVARVDLEYRLDGIETRFSSETEYLSTGAPPQSIGCQLQPWHKLSSLRQVRSLRVFTVLPVLGYVPFVSQRKESVASGNTVVLLLSIDRETEATFLLFMRNFTSLPCDIT